MYRSSNSYVNLLNRNNKSNNPSDFSSFSKMNESYLSYESFFMENEKKADRASLNCKKQQQECLILDRELGKLVDYKESLQKELGKNQALNDQYKPCKDYLESSLHVCGIISANRNFLQP